MLTNKNENDPAILYFINTDNTHESIDVSKIVAISCSEKNNQFILHTTIGYRHLLMPREPQNLINALLEQNPNIKSVDYLDYL